MVDHWGNRMRKAANRERMVWAAVTVVLLAALAIFVFSPRLLAADPEDETQAYLNSFAQVFRFTRDHYVYADKAQPKALIEGALKGMLDAIGDPYTTYFTAEETSQLDDVTYGKYSGVGLIISKSEKGAEVVAPIDGSPAYKAGISAGDIVTKVDGEPMAEISIDNIMKKIRGEVDSNVTLSILRGESVTFDVTVKRELVEVPAVKWEMIGSDIGYLRLIQFTSLAPDRCREALADFEKRGFKYLIVDLRSNGGGTLDAGIDIANLFIANGVIVGERTDRSERENRVWYADPKKVMVDPRIPMVVLTDKGTASASEILAGALKDTGRAVLCGTTTYGKGSVQVVHRLSDTGGEFKLTIALYHTPSGEFIDKKGIEPNIKIEEPKLTPGEEKSLTDLLNGKYVSDFVKSNPQPTDAQVKGFIAAVRNKGIVLDDRYMRRLVRQEINRTNNNPPLVDLDFDVTLQAAVKALRSGQVFPK
jgi:carboxyl-terminal processing protease